MQNSTADLSNLFGTALSAVRNNRQQINALDSYNGNHGDNMVHNLDVITQALRSEASQPPAVALETAARQLQTQGRGTTSQYYATGLTKAASQLRGKSALSNTDVTKLTHTMLGSVPARGGRSRASPARPGGAAGAPRRAGSPAPAAGPAQLPRATAPVRRWPSGRP